MHEVIPGVLHWTAEHPNIHKRVSSHLHLASRAAIDPLVPEEGVEALDTAERRPALVVLSNRHHLRHGAALADRFGCPIRCPRAGLHEFAGADVAVEPYDPGEELGPGLRAEEVGVLCPDESALLLADAEALLVADGVVRWTGDGPLGFVPDGLLGDDPAAIRRGLAEAYSRLAELPFRHLLLAHGLPVVEEGRTALAAFAAAARRDARPG